MTDVRVWVLKTLRRQGMPLAEIRAVLSADDPTVVRRHLELHRERMEERLREQTALLASVGSTLTDAIAGRSPRPSRSGSSSATHGWRRVPAAAGDDRPRVERGRHCHGARLLHG
jgi:DNA-binding transcriptional MerR regulator